MKRLRRQTPRKSRRFTRQGGPSIVRCPQQPFVIPDVMETSVVYTRTANVSTSGTSVSPNTVALIFSGNNLYDPDKGLILESYPVGHVQWATLYNRYQVISSTFEVTMHSVTAEPARFMVVAHPYTSNFPSGVAGFEDFSGLPYASPIHIVGPNSGTSVVPRYKRSITSSKILCRPDSQLFCAEVVSGFNTNATFQPASEWFWFLLVANDILGVGTVPAVTATIRITYRTRYYQNHQLTAHVHSTDGTEPPQNAGDHDPCAEDVMAQSAVEMKMPG